MVSTLSFSPNWFLGKYYDLYSYEEKFIQVTLTSAHLALSIYQTLGQMLEIQRLSTRFCLQVVF